MNALSRLPKLLISAFMLIAEPRVIRIFMFAIYSVCIVGGYLLTVNPSASIVAVLGGGLSQVFGLFLTIGGVLGLIAVLPGIWWLERAGVIAVGIAILMYLVVVISTQTSSLGFPFALLLTLFLVIRWMEIRRFDLAPRR